MLPPPDPSILANNPNFANLYNHLTTHILTPEGSTLANVAEHNSTSTQLDEARATAIQDELLLCVLEEIVSTTTDSIEEEHTNIPSQLPRKTGAASTQHAQQPMTTRSNSQLNLPPDLRDLIFNVTSYLSTSLYLDSTQSLPTDTEDLLCDDLTTFQSALPKIGPLLSNHIITTECTLSALLTPTPSTTTTTTTTTSTSTPTPHKPSKSRKQPSRPPLSTALSTLTTSTTHTQSHTLPTTLHTTLLALLSHLTSHHHQTTSHLLTLERHHHGTHSRHLTARSTYLSTIARGMSLKARILSLEREKAIYSDEELLERMEGEVERLDAEERRLERREEELVGLLGEYEGEGGKVGGGAAGSGGRRIREVGSGVGVGEQVFQVLGERYREVEGEIEEVKRDIERLETRVWRGR